MKKLFFLLIPFSLILTACGSSEQATQPLNLPDRPGEVRSTDGKPVEAPQVKSQTKIADGEYPVQQATYDDGNGEYTLMLLNAPSASYKTQKLQMARLTDEQIKEGKKPFLKVENQQPSLYLTEDFKIAYVHNVTEERQNPQTGQVERTVVRQESNFWSPFAGAVAGNIAGQMISNMLFRPQYYMPPQYQPGGIMQGYGGYGQTYGGAIDNYRERNREAPAVERNRTVFRSNGSIRNNRGNRQDAIRPPRDTTKRDRSTGSGFGSSDLKTGPSKRNSGGQSGGSFGSGRGSSSRSDGSDRSRR